jgi:hypothetical protein
LLTWERGGVGGGAKSYSGEKDSFSKNNSIISGKTQRKLKGNYWEKAKR